MLPVRPDPAVLRAFGVDGARPVLLSGGRGLTWRADTVVLRPHDGAAVSDWRATVLAELEHSPAFRTPRPVPTSEGSWRAGAWEALEWVPGHADPTRAADVIAAGTAFHEAIAHLDRPAFLDHADDAWSRADGMAWGTAPLPRHPALDRLGATFRPVRSPSQLVHRDLLGNVLFADGQPPTVIDWPPSWRPAGFGAAIAAVDAACWHGYPVDAVGALGDGIAEWAQLLVRALAFRIATLQLLDAWDPATAHRHGPVVDALV